MSTYNRKRSSKISYLSRENRKLSNEIENFLIEKVQIIETITEQTEYSEIQNKIDKMLNLQKNLDVCAAKCLYETGEYIHLIGSYTCGHRGCYVCNFKRQKRVRRKYMQFFENNPSLIQHNGKIYTKDTFLKAKNVEEYKYFRTDIKTGETKEISIKEAYKAQDNTIVRIVNNKTGKVLYRNTREGLENFEADKLKFTVEEVQRYEITFKKIAKKLVEYDLMHLVLTVPHNSKTGFLGNYFYYNEFINLFWELRRQLFWKDNVYGGEYGIETTNGQILYTVLQDGETVKRREFDLKKIENPQILGKQFVDSGLHIHAHALLLVKKFEKNRNFLHREILKAWNRLTVDEHNPDLRNEFTDFHIKQIIKGNELLTHEFVKNNMNPRGSTFIGLETIYTIENGQKVRTDGKEAETIIKAVLETIKYHFEPQAFQKKTGSTDLNLLFNILPAIHRVKLYARFGCLYGDTTIKLDEEDPAEDFRETANMSTIEREEEKILKDYKLGNARYVFHDKEKDNKIIFSRYFKQSAIDIQAGSGSEAIHLSNQYYNDFITKKKEE